MHWDFLYTFKVRGDLLIRFRYRQSSPLSPYVKEGEWRGKWSKKVTLSMPVNSGLNRQISVGLIFFFGLLKINTRATQGTASV